MDEVGRWLEELGLGRYAAAFSENNIEFDLLLELTEADIEKLGVSSLGHRKKLLKAIAVLSDESVATEAIKKRSTAGPSISRALSRRLCRDFLSYVIPSWATYDSELTIDGIRPVALPRNPLVESERPPLALS